MTEPNDSPRPTVVLPLRTWLTISHLLVFTLPILALLGTGALARDLIQQTEEDITHQSALLAITIEQMVDARRPQESMRAMAADLSTMFQRVKQTTLAGVRLTDHHGVVVATSGDVTGEDLSAEPEVSAGLGGESAVFLRPRGVTRHAQLSSPSRFADIRVFVGHPVMIDDEVIGVVVISRTPREELQTLYHMAPRLIWGMGLSLLLTLTLALYAAKRSSRSLHSVSIASHRLADGEAVDDTLLIGARRSRVAEVAVVGQAVSSMSARLQKRLAYISEFAGNVAHEFRTPLSTLMGTVELIRDDPQMPADQQTRFLDIATNELQRLDHLVGGLLKLARAEESSQRSEMRMDPLLTKLSHRFPRARITAGGGRLLGDATQLDLAITNLVENAYRYGGDQVTVEVRGWAEGDLTHVEVIDDGPGIDAANLQRVFERFFTTARTEGGTGIGLALVKAVCAAHGGEVTVQSRPGQTRFQLTLPKGPAISD